MGWGEILIYLETHDLYMLFNVGSKKNRELRKGELTLQVDNRARVALWPWALDLCDYHLDLVL